MMPERAMIETIDYSKSEQYTLSIRLSTDGFSFSIYDPIHEGTFSFFEKEIDASLSLTANLKQTYRELEWLNHPYKRVNVILTGKRFTLVPLELFEDEQAETLFYYNHPHKENETVQYNILKSHNIVVVFGMDRSAHLFISEHLPSARFYFQTSPLIEHFAVKSRLGNSKKLYASLRNDAIDLYGYERGHLLLVNSFECKKTEDRIYYLLYTWNKLEFNQERDELHLTGLLKDKETLVRELRKFIQQVFIMSPETNIDIQALTTCE